MPINFRLNPFAKGAGQTSGAESSTSPQPDPLSSWLPSPWGKKQPSACLSKQQRQGIAKLLAQSHEAGRKFKEAMHDVSPRPREEERRLYKAAQRAGLELARGLDDIAGGDVLPAEQRLQEHARLVKTGASLLNTRFDPPLSVNAAQRLEMLVAAALWHHSWARLGGMPPEHLPPIQRASPEGGIAASTIHGKGSRWFNRSGVKAFEMRSGVVAAVPTIVLHEGGHAHQLNTSRDIPFWPSPVFMTSQLPHAGALEAARQLKPGDTQAQRAWYPVRAEEVGSYTTEAELAQLTAPLGRPMNVSEGLQPAASKLLPLLGEIAWDTMTPLSQSKSARCAEAVVGCLGELDEAMRSKAWDGNEERAFSTWLDGLADKAKLAGDGPDKLEKIALELQDKVGELKAKHGPALHHPRSVEPAFAGEPGALEKQVEQYRTRSIEMLGARLQSRPGPRTAYERADKLEAALSGPKQASGFNQSVQVFQRQVRDGVQPDPGQVRDAVIALACHYIGLPGGLPNDALPDIHIFSPGTNSREPVALETYPSVPGLNGPLPALGSNWRQSTAEGAEDSHQKPWAGFRSDLWRFNVPQRFFDPGEVDKLPRRLAGLAGRFSWLVASMLAHRDGLGEDSEMEMLQAGGLDGRYIVPQLAALGLVDMSKRIIYPHVHPMLLPHRPPPPRVRQPPPAAPGNSVAQVLFSQKGGLASNGEQPTLYPFNPGENIGAVPPGIQAFFDSNPDSGAQALRTLVENAAPFTDDLLTRKALLPRLKHQAADTADPQQAQAGRAVQALKAQQMHRDSGYGLWCRAVKDA